MTTILSASTNAPGRDTARDTAFPGARFALVLLLLINMFNYIDRQVLAAVEPEIAVELLNPARNPGAAFWLGLRPEAEFWTGLLGTAFLVTYMLTAPVFGYFADRM